jgi:ribosomal protein L16 Arg81 hydroxylase
VFKERRTRRGRVLQDLDPAAMNEKLRDGATLVLDAANELSPPLQRLCAGLSGELIASCQANLYACWGCSQGFDVHWDDHDLFVVQVQGRKRWAFYGFTREHPSYRDRHAEHRKPEAPIEEIVLEPGDMLYLPRGYWHAAVGTGEPTLHLTIGVTRKTGSDFLHWLADDALSDVLARTDLPLESDDETLGARIRVLLATATGAHAAEDLARRYRRHVAASIPQRPTLSFPFLGAEGEPYASDLRLALADGPAHLRAADRPGAFVLSHRGVEYTLAADLRRPVGMIVGGPVAFAEFETAAGPDASAFVREMLARGVFVLAPERTA